MPRLLGKRPAVHDPRLPMLAQVADLSRIKVSATSTQWHSDLPDKGVPMLGNDQAGDCVFASIAHYVQLARLYADRPLLSEPTAEEALAAYSAVTGYDPADWATDNGTVVMGPGGAFEYWIMHGILIGGERNHLTQGVRVDHTDPDHIALALTLGPVFCGAALTQQDVDAAFLWEASDQPIIGGHEFLLVGMETISTGKRYYDVLTWDGLWRCTGEWVAQRVDEMACVLDTAFFDKAKIDPAGIAWNLVAAGIHSIQIG